MDPTLEFYTNPKVCVKPLLTRQGHYCANKHISRVIPILETSALDDIYNCVEKCMKGKSAGLSKEEDLVYWENEFFHRDTVRDGEREIFRLTGGDRGVFSEGIRQFRRNTRVVFKDISLGTMWKLLPASANTYSDRFDGCFTINDDGIKKKMDTCNQIEQFGTTFDITLENPKYILWTSFA